MSAKSTPQEPAQEDEKSIHLRHLIEAIEASAKAVLPRYDDALLESIVEVAARIFGAGGTSILLIDEDKQTLEFKVAYGPNNQELVGKSFPIHQGIAGYVVLTGQPIAISDVEQDARFNQDFAKSTGYVPKSIMATPLVSGDQVIGVMEVLDKINSPSFGLADMELLGLFARQAAIAIHQAQEVEQVGQALLQGIKQFALANDSPSTAALLKELDAETSRDEEEVHDILTLANLFYDIAELGEAEREACIQVLQVFSDFAQTRSTSSPQLSISF
jgi:GAF domain-containing protein